MFHLSDRSSTVQRTPITASADRKVAANLFTWLLAVGFVALTLIGLRGAPATAQARNSIAADLPGGEAPVRVSVPQSITLTAIDDVLITNVKVIALKTASDRSRPDPERPFKPQALSLKYDNVTNDSGVDHYQNAAATVGANGITRLVADDLTLSGNVDGLQVSQLAFIVANGNASAVTVRMRLRFWYDDGPSGGPGTYFLNASGAAIGYTYGPLTFGPGISLVPVTPPAGFTFPAGRTTFWAGVAFDNNDGTTGATLSELDNFGQTFFNPPDLGSSTDNFFETTAADSFFGIISPTGTITNNGGAPIANLGWQFTFDNVCPTVVTSTLNSGPGSLRSALSCAVPGDTITFGLAANSVITVASELVVSKTLTIDGSTATKPDVNGNNTTRVFNVTAPATLISFTIMNGSVTGSGAGLLSTSDLTLTNMAFTNNVASISGGGVLANGKVYLSDGRFQNNTSSTGYGGGLFVTNTLIATGTHFIGNSANLGGGGLQASSQATLTNLSFLTNTAQGAGGGALLRITSSLIGGLFQNNISTASGGGGLFTNSSLVLTDTQFISNTAQAGGGADVIGSATLKGGLFQKNTSLSDMGGGLVAGNTLTLTGTKFLSNTANGTGGGAYAGIDALLTNGLFRNNTSTDQGGGLYAVGSLTMTDTQFISNTSLGNAGGGAYVHAAILNGGLFQINSTEGAIAGGLYADSSLVLSGTRFISNVSGYGGGGAYSYAATLNGGLFQGNSTTSNGSGEGGGGLYVWGPLALTDTQFISNTASGAGGGLYADSTALLIGGLFQNNITTNDQGGGLYNQTGGLTLNGTRFISNTAQQDGGGAVTKDGPATLIDGLFQRNTSLTGVGGGLYSSDYLILTDTQFISNTALTEGGGLLGDTGAFYGGLFQNNTSLSKDGGGLYMSNPFTLLDTRFISNTAYRDGGGLYANATATLIGGLFQNNVSLIGGGGGLYTSDFLTLTNGVFLSNTAYAAGGGLAAWYPSILNDGLFQNNTSHQFGGGLYMDERLMLTGTQFIANTAPQGGGLYQDYTQGGRFVNALFARNVATSTFGAAMYLTQTGRLQILHATIANPSGGSSSAIYVATGTVGITDTIIANYATGISNGGGSVYQNYNLLFNLSAPTTGIVNGGANNPSGNPMFVNPAADNYHLQFGSAALNTGVNASVLIDIDGQPRPMGGRFDIGYDEFLFKTIYLPLVLKNF